LCVASSSSPAGEDVALTTGEFDLLAVLAKHPGRVFGREALMDLTRGRSLEAFDRSIDARKSPASERKSKPTRKIRCW
jgi:DNA-binding response OmpR family regulator